MIRDRPQWILLAGAVAFTMLAGPAGAQPSAPLELPPLEELQATRERPLFSPERRPDAVEAVAPEEPESAPVQEATAMPFQLTGIVLWPEVRVVILRNKATGEELRLREGDRVDVWTIEQIAPTYLLLKGKTKRVRLRLYDESAKPNIQVNRHGDREDSTAVPDSDKEVDEEVVPSEAPQSLVPNQPRRRPPPQQGAGPGSRDQNQRFSRPRQRPNARDLAAPNRPR